MEAGYFVAKFGNGTYMGWQGEMVDSLNDAKPYLLSGSGIAEFELETKGQASIWILTPLPFSA